MRAANTKHNTYVELKTEVEKNKLRNILQTLWRYDSIEFANSEDIHSALDQHTTTSGWDVIEMIQTCEDMIYTAVRIANYRKIGNAVYEAVEHIESSR